MKGEKHMEILLWIRNNLKNENKYMNSMMAIKWINKSTNTYNDLPIKLDE